MTSFLNYNVALNYTGNKYRKNRGGEKCNANAAITSSDICETAAKALGLSYCCDIDLGDNPAGCYWSDSEAFNNKPSSISSDAEYSNVRGGICLEKGTCFIFNLLQSYIYTFKFNLYMV